MQVKDFLRTEVTGNNVSFNGLGLGLGSGRIARNNVMDNNTYGFHAFNIQQERGSDTPIINVDVDASNTVSQSSTGLISTVKLCLQAPAVWR